MPASYPTSAKTFSSKSAGQAIDPNHINDLQLEVAALEQDLIAGVPVARGGTGNTSLTANRVLLGNGTSAVAVAGAGTSGQVLTSNGASAPTFQDPSQAYARDIVHGRLTLTSGTAVTIGDVTGASTIYFALHKGNQIGLYTGSVWQAMTIAELSIATSGGTASKPHDLFVDYNSGTPALVLTAWTDGTTRATALTTQDGVLVKNGTPAQRYVGTVYLDGSKNCEDSFANRYVWNYYNRLPREMRALEGTDSWNYTTATWRQARATATNQLGFVIGVAEVPLEAQVYAFGLNSGGATIVQVAVGLDSTTAPTAGNVGRGAYVNGTTITPIQSFLRVYPSVGLHYAAWLEYSAAAGTTTWYGDNGDNTLWQAGITGMIHG